MVTKKKATKKTGKAKRVNVGLNGPVGYQAARLPEVVPFGTALVAFEAAFDKVSNIRKVLLGREGDGFDVVSNHARRLADAASNLQNAAWTLRESAYHEADK